jgi:RNA polymerase primary sigma factor
VADDRNGRLKQLIDTGNKRGYVLYDEIERLLPENYEGGRKLDDLLARLESAGVPILLEPADDPKTEKIYAPANVHPDDAVTVYLREVAKVPNLTKENEIELAKRIERGGQQAEAAKKDLVEANLRLVVCVAERYGDGGVDLLNLIQAGNLGLLKAAEGFDYQRGYKFSIYATCGCDRRSCGRCGSKRARTTMVTMNHDRAAIDAGACLVKQRSLMGVGPDNKRAAETKPAAFPFGCG